MARRIGNEGKDQTMAQVFFNARELWASQGSPYYEPDKVTNLAPVNRELLHAGFWRSYVALRTAASVRMAAKFDQLAGASALRADASVV